MENEEHTQVRHKRDIKGAYKKKKKAGLHFHYCLLTNGVYALAFFFLGPQFKVDGAAAHSQCSFRWTRQVGDRPETHRERFVHHLPALIQVTVTLENYKYHSMSQKLPLEALPGKDVGGIYDVFSNLHTSS